MEKKPVETIEELFTGMAKAGYHVEVLEREWKALKEGIATGDEYAKNISYQFLSGAAWALYTAKIISCEEKNAILNQLTNERFRTKESDTDKAAPQSTTTTL